MGKQRGDLLQGTLELLILNTLEGGEGLHGYAVARCIEDATGDVLRVEEGSLYPALHRMERRGWLTSHEGRSENNRKARFYRLTAAGREQLAEQTSTWNRLSNAVSRALSTA